MLDFVPYRCINSTYPVWSLDLSLNLDFFNDSVVCIKSAKTLSTNGIDSTPSGALYPNVSSLSLSCVYFFSTLVIFSLSLNNLNKLAHFKNNWLIWSQFAESIHRKWQLLRKANTGRWLVRIEKLRHSKGQLILVHYKN